MDTSWTYKFVVQSATWTWSN